MALEIERKFLVKKCTNFEDLAFKKIEISQGYLCTDINSTIRVRVKNDKGYITVKSKNRGAVRSEWEYEIPVKDAREMLSLPGVKVLRKTRYLIEVGRHIWEVDVFGGKLEGLIIAEVELNHENEEFLMPDFVDREVTGQPEYYNSNLVNSL